MAIVYDKSQMWLHMMDKLLEGKAQGRGSKEIINYADLLVTAYEERFVKPGTPSKDGPAVKNGDLKKQMADHR